MPMLMILETWEIIAFIVSMYLMAGNYVPDKVFRKRMPYTLAGIAVMSVLGALAWLLFPGRAHIGPYLAAMVIGFGAALAAFLFILVATGVADRPKQHAEFVREGAWKVYTKETFFAPVNGVPIVGYDHMIVADDGRTFVLRNMLPPSKGNLKIKCGQCIDAPEGVMQVFSIVSDDSTLLDKILFVSNIIVAIIGSISAGLTDAVSTDYLIYVLMMIPIFGFVAAMKQTRGSWRYLWLVLYILFASGMVFGLIDKLLGNM